MLAAILLIPLLLNLTPDFYREKTFYSACLASLFAAYHLAKRVHWSAGLALGYALLSASYLIIWPFHPYSQLGAVLVTSFDATVAASALILIAAIVTGLLLPKDATKYLPWYAQAESVAVLTHHGHNGWGFLGNPSMDAAFLASLIPWCLAADKRGRSRFIFSLLPIWACLKSNSSTGILGLGIVAISYMRSWKSALAAVVVLIFGYASQQDQLFSPDGRMEIWVAAMHFFNTNLNQFLGAGLGTFTVWGPLIWKSADGHHVFTWLHNDWMQILFELGAAGLFLVLLMTFYAIRRAWGDRALLSAIVTYAFTMGTQMPLRQLISGIYAAYLLRLAFDANPYKFKGDGIGSGNGLPGT